jgi:outer membrane lipoprotein-sorting protein
MKTLSTALFALAFCLGALTSTAQTADEIVNKYITAIGGRDAINSVKTIYEEGSLNVMGNEAPSTTYIVSGKGFKSQVDFNGQQIVQVVTDKGGWSINPMMGQTSATPMPEEQLKSSRYQLDIGGPMLDYKTKGSKIELLGKDTAGGGAAYKLKLTTKDSVSMNLYIDVKTGYLTRMVTRPPGQDGDITINFSDFKKVDGGFVMPYAQEIVLPQLTIDMTSKKVEINKTIDPTIFDMPK